MDTLRSPPIVFVLTVILHTHVFSKELPTIVAFQTFKDLQALNFLDLFHRNLQLAWAHNMHSLAPFHQSLLDVDRCQLMRPIWVSLYSIRGHAIFTGSTYQHFVSLIIGRSGRNETSDIMKHSIPTKYLLSLYDAILNLNTIFMQVKVSAVFLFFLTAGKILGSL